MNNNPIKDEMIGKLMQKIKQENDAFKKLLDAIKKEAKNPPPKGRKKRWNKL